MPDPADTLIFTLKSSIMDRHRQLTLTPEYLEFDDNDAAGSPPTRILRSDLEGIRHGGKTIRGYKFPIGRIYCIDLRSTTGQVIKLRLKSIYRIRVRQLESKHRCRWHSIRRKGRSHSLGLSANQALLEVLHRILRCRSV